MYQPEQEAGVDETGLQELLTYLPAFRVLVCRSCQFAVQPSALSSHLLRHQIYRNERRQLLNKFQKLQLWEPEAVPIPPPSISPIPGLPVHRGHRCMATGCEHACVAQKRMSQHWSDQHCESDSRNVDSRPALLQTFFRGNKIRYFEVSSGSVEGAPPTPDSDDPSHVSTDSPHGAEVPGFLNSFSTSAPQPTVPLDMEVLRLLHHYTTSTARNINRGSETHDFWSTAIPQEGFKHPFLMYGILGVSALHLAASSRTTDVQIVKELRKTALHYQSIALPLYRAAMNNPYQNVANALIAFARLICIQRCALDQTEEKLAISHSTPHAEGRRSSISSSSIPTHDEPSTLPIVESIYLLKGHIDSLLALQPVLPPTSGFILPPSIRSGLEGKAPFRPPSSAPSHDIVSHFLHKHGHFPPSLQAVLLPLPEAIARSIVNSQTNPSSPTPHLTSTASTTTLSDEEQMAIITEVAVIMETSYSISYANNPSPVMEMWNGVESLPIRLSKEFLDMVEAGHPTALLLIAFWTLLLRRQEANYWFLVGQSTRLLRCILANLDKKGEEYRIVEGLLDLEV